jgi:antitoxin (DNA-binding transcriptional repressor) of toxin-antitoxin stability system
VKVVKISDAKANLSRHLQFVRRGGRIRVVDRDTAVADIVPIDVEADPDDEALLVSIERRGVGHRGKVGRLPREVFETGPKDAKGSGLVDALLEERRSSR